MVFGVLCCVRGRSITFLATIFAIVPLLRFHIDSASGLHAQGRDRHRVEVEVHVEEHEEERRGVLELHGDLQRRQDEADQLHRLRLHFTGGVQRRRVFWNRRGVCGLQSLLVATPKSLFAFVPGFLNPLHHRTLAKRAVFPQRAARPAGTIVLRRSFQGSVQFPSAKRFSSLHPTKYLRARTL